jgi:hypothetical protein
VNSHLNHAKSYRNDEKANRAIGSASKALENAEKYMFKLKMGHAVFDEMTARAERLRFNQWPESRLREPNLNV